jgi:phosphoribosylanthranilate isomerase
MVWIKICGITSRQDAEAAAAMGADCLGFVFSTDSPRRIGPAQAEKITGGLKGISRAGVFVNEKIEKIKSYIDLLGLDHVQLSGDEDLSYLRKLKCIAGTVRVIKAIRLKRNGYEEAGRIAEKYLEYADCLLLDSYDRYQYGGTGKTMDWEKAKDIAEPGRTIISGGLYHGNVGKALGALDPFGVDASSRLETSPGIKDLQKVRKFIEPVRRLERQDQVKL